MKTDSHSIVLHTLVSFSKNIYWWLFFRSEYLIVSLPFYRELGIGTLSKCDNEQQEMLRLAETMFDTKLPPGVVMLQPFSEESSIKKIAVQVCYKNLNMHSVFVPYRQATNSLCAWLVVYMVILKWQ